MPGEGSTMPHVEGRILIVDDEPAIIRMLEGLLRQAGFELIQSTSDPFAVEDLFRSCSPDLVMLDINMPGMNGFEILERLNSAMENDAYVPVLVLTANDDQDVKNKALTAGARDLIMKPLDPVELIARAENLLEARSLHVQLRDEKKLLEMTVDERTRELRTTVTKLKETQIELHLSRGETIHHLSLAAEFRDDETARHIQRMGLYCRLLSQRIGFDEERAEVMRLAGEMHDVGKIGIPDSILLKPGKLTDEERKIMQGHPEIGYDILAGSRSELLMVAATIALTHHERLDGGGYPRGLKGDQVPLEGRIAAIADVYDALTTDRVYRRAFPIERAIAMMTEDSGSHFDPDLLDMFLESMDDVLTIMQQHPDPRGDADSAEDSRESVDLTT